MCGIFGIFATKADASALASLRALLEHLYRLSESRGKESAGLCAYLPDSAAQWIEKSALPAHRFIRGKAYRAAMGQLMEQRALTGPVALLAHSRLVTNGTAAEPRNNQPVTTGAVTVVHNGIITNIDALWDAHTQSPRTAEVDSEIISATVAAGLAAGESLDAIAQRFYAQMQGAASIALLAKGHAEAVLATNTGDLYMWHNAAQNYHVFASERFILTEALRMHGITAPQIVWIEPGQARAIDLSTGATRPFAVPRPADAAPKTHHHAPIILNATADESLLRYNPALLAELKRCSCCVLPETFPFITFDDAGVCNYCRNYTPKYKHLDPAKAKADFIASLAHYRKPGSAPDAIVPFSGGRDSCYGLHLIKKEFGLKPITFTYDWGMVTDLARRNIARMCGQLGIQNILVSADIQKKRDNIRRNVAAWLNKPDLGIVPLFMAGDKHFFTVTNELKQQTGIKLDLWCANPLENTDFKSGFCGVEPDFAKKRLDYLSKTRKLRMIAHYGKQFAMNPRYFNRSLADTFGAFMAYYFAPRTDFYFIFNDMVWNEDEVNRTLLSEYDWETSPDSPSTWRIGDGTAPFYNYIYVTANGFSEFDTFRSNQIREGMITRAEALQHVLRENAPRVASLRWYLETVGLDFNRTIARINTLDVRGLHR